MTALDEFVRAVQNSWTLGVCRGTKNRNDRVKGCVRTQMLANVRMKYLCSETRHDPRYLAFCKEQDADEAIRNEANVFAKVIMRHQFEQDRKEEGLCGQCGNPPWRGCGNEGCVYIAYGNRHLIG